LAAGWQREAAAASVVLSSGAQWKCSWMLGRSEASRQTRLAAPGTALQSAVVQGRRHSLRQAGRLCLPRRVPCRHGGVSAGARLTAHSPACLRSSGACSSWAPHAIKDALNSDSVCCGPAGRLCERQPAGRLHRPQLRGELVCYCQLARACVACCCADASDRAGVETGNMPPVQRREAGTFISASASSGCAGLLC